MSIGEMVSSAVLNMLNLYIIIRIIGIFLDKKKVSRFFSLVVYFFVWALNWGVYYLYDNVYYTSGSLLVLLFLAVLILYRGNLFRKIVSVCSCVGIGMVVEEIVWRFLSSIDDSGKTGGIGTFLSSLILIVIVLILERIFIVDKAQYISKESYVNIIIVLTGNIILLYILAEIAKEGSIEILLAVSVIGIIDISTFYLYDKVNEVYSQKIERRMVEEQIAMYKNQFEIMQQSQRNMSTLRHDFKNHMYMLKSYMDDKKYAEADAYIKEIEDFIEVSKQHVNTGNRTVDMILNYAMERAVRMPCDVKTKISIPENSFMPEFDLIMLLGNIMDNALEALEKTDEGVLSFEMDYQKGILLICSLNTFDGNIEKRGNSYITRKKDKKNHGMGLKNIKEIVKKYNGKQTIKTEGNVFAIKIILYL